MKHLSSRKGVAAVITAAVLLLCLAVNIVVGVIAFRHRMITDLTDEGLYTVAPIYRTMLDDTFASVSAQRAEAGEQPVKVRILFCDDPDVLIANTSQRYVYYTALAFRERETVKFCSRNVERRASPFK